MYRQRGHISTVLLLLAAIVVPFQQTLAATCCCRLKLDVSKILSDSRDACCCSRKQTASDHSKEIARTCCPSNRTEKTSSPDPCRCPAGSCGEQNPDATEPVTPVDCIVDVDLQPLDTTIVAFAVHDTSTTFSNRIVVNSPSGADICILLCRFSL